MAIRTPTDPPEPTADEVTAEVPLPPLPLGLGPDALYQCQTIQWSTRVLDGRLGRMERRAAGRHGEVLRELRRQDRGTQEAIHEVAEAIEGERRQRGALARKAGRAAIEGARWAGPKLFEIFKVPVGLVAMAAAAWVASRYFGVSPVELVQWAVPSTRTVTEAPLEAGGLLDGSALP